ncbi:hypothetical protein TWF730_005381 [Orbilia blumenaviensis]|uniref:WLM domain-containing protein n=1 Tax=Orbilia blumenaviensis TaxID=1796055 RepID=A0AAV9VL34_9PEZI
MDPASPPHQPGATDQQDQQEEQEETETHTVLISHSGHAHPITLPSKSTLLDLRHHLQTIFSISPAYQKLTAPKLGLLKDDTLPVTSLPPPPKRILLIGSSDAAIKDIQLANSPAAKGMRRFGGSGPIKAAVPGRRVDWTKQSAASEYTFGTIKVLTHLPNSSRSEAYLRRLSADAGIKSVMQKHRFSVGVLSELDPAEHTTHESRTLGLNKNKGEEILLRLRTDAYDGYRDYKTVRKTLCHELAHNVFGEHDKHFWELYRVILKGVKEADWRHGGRTVEGERVRWEGEERERELVEMEDGGGWTGGSFVLGGSGVTSSSGGGGAGGSVEDRRAMAARAAEERAKKAMGGGSEAT